MQRPCGRGAGTSQGNVLHCGLKVEKEEERDERRSSTLEGPLEQGTSLEGPREPQKVFK